MIYREWLVMRKALPVFLGCIIVLFVLARLSGHMKMTFVDCMSVGAWMGALFASIFGVALGNSSRKGARTFWVLPQQRWQNALGVVIIDAMAVVLVVAAISVLVGLVAVVFAMFPGNSMHWNFDVYSALNAVGLAVGVYGWAAIVGMVGRKLPYLGISVMPVLLLWFVFAMSESQIGAWLRKPIMTNPFALYFVQEAGAKSHGLGDMASALAWVTPQTSVMAMAVIATAGCIAAITMWSKAEVLA